MRQCRNLLRVDARQRPPAMPDFGAGSEWQYEPKALATDFQRFEVQALATSNPTISIFDYIGPDGQGGGVPVGKVAAALRTIGDKPITVEINSPGGNYFEGVAIYNLLRRHTQPIAVQVLGIAASAASVIAMAGDTIAIAHNAEIMIHQAMGIFAGNADDMEDALATLRKLDGAMADTYAARTGLDRDKLIAMMKAETYIGGQDAVDQGFADSVMEREAQMPVYAEGPQFPSDEASLNDFLAKQDMPRSERRNLLKALKTTPGGSEPSPARRAGDEQDAVATALLARIF